MPKVDEIGIMLKNAGLGKIDWAVENEYRIVSETYFLLPGSFSNFILTGFTNALNASLNETSRSKSSLSSLTLG